MTDRIAAIVLLGAFLAVPLVQGEFAVVVATEVLILGLFALSFNLIHGYMGQISFGHAAFFGLGAYGTALVFRAFKGAGTGVSYAEFALSLLAGFPLAMVGALLVGYFCSRLTGIYFAILSLAFGELIFHIVFSWYGFTGGDDGIQGLLPPPWFRDPVNYYYFTLAVVLGASVVLWRVTRSPFGYVLRMLRDNPRRAAFLGINVRLCVLCNFVIAGAFAGVAGSLWGPFSRSVSPVLLGWMQSGIPIFMTLIGGSGHFTGPMVGSAIYTALNAYVTRFTPYWPLAIGIIILLLVLFLAGGILSVAERRAIARR
ncbi:MAG: branched-chain amino acid ABC transporter permease [Rhodospirillales bacterium]|nr:branched-chain amino acid ABC transporter permease [Rhodospirillales bacterium]